VNLDELGRLRFAVWLQRQREAIGLTQTELAARAGMTRALINAYERGRIGLPGVDYRRQLAEALNVRHVDMLVAAGEIAADELTAGTPRDFTRYPELQNDIEALTPDAAEALHDFMYFLVTKPPAAGGMRRPAGRADWLSSYRKARREMTGDEQ
jgi:transcriptional regulator with XRE-family HTH domain